MATELLVGRSLVPHQADSWFLRVGGYGFELLVADTWASFNEPSHAVNFAGYLFRQGRERPNDLTHLNEVRWLGYSGSADGRDGHARTVMTSTAAHLAATWEGWTNEVMFSLPPRPAASSARLPIGAYTLMWEVLDELCEDLGIEQPGPLGQPPGPGDAAAPAQDAREQQAQVVRARGGSRAGGPDLDAGRAAGAVHHQGLTLRGQPATKKPRSSVLLRGSCLRQ